MRIKTMAVLLALLFLIFLAPASAMTFGEARVGTTFVVSGLPQGAVVQFILNGGVPIFAIADANGKASYLPLLQGSTLDIVVMQGGVVIDSGNTKVAAPGGGGGGEVPPVLTSITLTPSSASLITGGSQSFTATALNGFVPMAGVNISFTSSNTSVGTVAPANAITGSDGNASVTFTASAAGSALVNATNGSVIVSAGITVTAAVPPVLTSITLTPSSVSLLTGRSQSFNATARNGSVPMAGANISFTSSNTSVGTVSPANAITGSDGNASVTFTASAAGSALVNATNGSVIGSAGVTVTAASIVVQLPIDPVNKTTNATVIITSPMGNVTVTIPNGTNATDMNGIPLANVSVISTTTLTANESIALAAIGYGNIGEIVNLGPEGAVFDPPIQVRFNYSEPLPGGISEDSLEVRFFNASTNTWEPLPVIERNTTLNYIVANVTHFSTFALIGKMPAAAVSPGGGGGGGGTGGGGVVTAEPYDNIARFETYDKNLVSNKPVIYTFKLPEHGIYEIAVTGKESENYISLRVEALKGPTKIAGISAPPGTVYKNVNIWTGSKRIKEGQIRFKVENTWIANNKIASGDLLLVRWDGSQWVKLVTSELKKDDTYTFFEANTEGFSSFAMTALKGGVMPTASETGKAEITATPVKPAGKETATPVPTEKTPGFEAIIAVFAIAMLAASLNKNRKRR
jgi:PGF-pre-PGF domain-containing protein